MSHQPLLNTYMRTAHSTGLLILSLLATRLGINPSEITSRHRLEEKSGDLVRLTRGPPRARPEMPEIQTPSHTDFGSITLLMNWLGGLQVWSESARKAGPLEPDSEGEWLWVKPKKGCAIINLGDAMVRFTNGALCSGRYVNENDDPNLVVWFRTPCCFSQWQGGQCEFWSQTTSPCNSWTCCADMYLRSAGIEWCPRRASRGSGRGSRSFTS